MESAHTNCSASIHFFPWLQEKLVSMSVAVHVCDKWVSQGSNSMAQNRGAPCVLTAPDRPPSFAHSSRLDTRGMSFSLSRVLELHEQYDSRQTVTGCLESC